MQTTPYFGWFLRVMPHFPPWKRGLIACFLSGLLLCPPVFSAGSLMGKVNAVNGLTVRSGPGKEHEKVMRVPAGSQVEILEQDEKNVEIEGRRGVWLKIRFEEQTGWAFGGFISCSAPLQTAPGNAPKMPSEPEKAKEPVQPVENQKIRPPEIKDLSRSIPMADPGKALGGLTLGMKREVVLTLLGKPTRSEKAPGNVVLEYWNRTADAQNQAPDVAGGGKAGSPETRIFFRSGKAVQIEAWQYPVKVRDMHSPAMTLAVFRKWFSDVKKIAYSGGDYACIFHDSASQGIAFLWETQDDEVAEETVFPKAMVIHVPRKPVLTDSNLVIMGPL